MKYVRTPGFLIDLRRLPDEHRKLFVQAAHEILRPALDAGATRGGTVAEGPSRPPDRCELLDDVELRGTRWPEPQFRLAEVAGETVVVWLGVGNHGIYDS
jgi:hypothetical protein